jgi:hypothetical protein
MSNPLMLRQIEGFWLVGAPVGEYTDHNAPYHGFDLGIPLNTTSCPWLAEFCFVINENGDLVHEEGTP